MHAGSKLVVSTHDPDTLSNGTYAGRNRFRSGPHRVQVTFLSLFPIISYLSLHKLIKKAKITKYSLKKIKK